jgi:hypothetical protein
VEQFLIATGVVALIFVVTCVVATFAVVRGVRRRYRRARARLHDIRSAPVSVLRVSGSAAASSFGSPGWWMVQNRRHRMWKAVTSAEHAVDVARKAEVAVGDLPSLAHRLRTAATGVDAVLRAGARHGGGTLGVHDREECDRVVAAAVDLRAAALSSLRSSARADTDGVLTAVQVEIAALAAGLRAAHP